MDQGLDGGGDPLIHAARGHARRHLAWAAVVALPVVFLAVFFAWPLLTVLRRGLAGTGTGAAWDVLASPGVPDALVTTLALAALGTVGSVALGVPAAWALYRLRWRGQVVARAIVAVPFVLPTVVVAAAFGALFAKRGLLGFTHLDQSMTAIVLALVFFNVSVVARVVGSAWAALDPGAQLAARTLGASRWRAFRTVTVPALAPALGAAAAVVLLFCSTSFGIVLVLGGTRVRTIETEIYFQVNQFLDLHAAAVLAIVQLVFVAAALALASWARRGRDRVATGRELDGSRPARGADGPWLVLSVAAVGALIVLPAVALVERSLRVAGGGHSLANYGALFTQPAQSVLPVSVAQAALNSTVTALIAAAIAAALTVAVSAATVRGPRWARWIDAVAMGPLGVSAVVIGLGMLLTLNREIAGVDLRTSWWLVPLAQAVVALPLAVRILVPATRAIDPRLRAAGASLGASPWRVWRTVDWPLLRGPVALAAGFAFAIAMGEFGATAFVARPDRPTLPLAIARLLGRPGAENVGMGFAAVVLLALLTAAVMLTTERLRTRVRADV
ncbi:ABC transporter permease [Demequina sp.]|uniref:ABC transporter permease n=1 Tax=Demequina sp. TaxID=2050685 RepID=UPI003D0EFE70